VPPSMGPGGAETPSSRNSVLVGRVPSTSSEEAWPSAERGRGR
jgi:hypothetical protein